MIFKDIDDVNEEDRYVIETRNTINCDIYYDYFNVKTFLLVKQIIKEPYFKITTHYSDFRILNEMTYAFRSETDISPTGKNILIQTEELSITLPIEQKTFALPEQDVRDFSFDNTFNAESIPFLFVENTIFLPVRLNGDTLLGT